MQNEKNPVTQANSKIIRAPSEFREQLFNQLYYIDTSAKAFDDGNHHEAARLATTIRVLLHEPKNNGSSLLKLLKIKDTLRFVDTGLYRDRLDAALAKRYNKDNLVVAGIRRGEAGLVEERSAGGGTYGWFAPLREKRFHPDSPHADALLTPQPFDFWWTTPLVEASDGRLFSREELVRIMADQDGGAHVDPSLNRDYHALCTDHLGVQKKDTMPGDEPIDISAAGPLPDSLNLRNNVARASVRQIAYELALTLHRHLETHPSEAGDPISIKMYEPMENNKVHSTGFHAILMGEPIDETTPSNERHEIIEAPASATNPNRAKSLSKYSTNKIPAIDFTIARKNLSGKYFQSKEKNRK
jgi:hypothetical protein